MTASEFLVRWGLEIVGILVESGPYLVLGLVLAGFIQALLPAERIVRHMGKDDLRSVFMATLVGAPLPLCSCAVIPTAVELRKKGASKGATTAFLISTPETDLEAIGLTWALIDPVMTVVRPLTGIVTALGAGSVVNWMERRGMLPNPAATTIVTDECCPPAIGEIPSCDPAIVEAEHAHDADSGHSHGHDHSHDHPHDHAHDHGMGAPAATGRRRSPLAVTREALSYAFGPFLADLTPWFIIGFILSGLISVIVPQGFFGDVIPTGLPAMLLMLVIAAPMYICAAASTPIAAALIAKGLDPGAALVFMLAGPATNVATMIVVLKLLGRWVLVAYLGMIVVAAILFGLFLNWLYPALDIDLQRVVTLGVEASTTSNLAYVCAAVVGVGIVVHTWRLSLLRSFGRWLADAGIAPSPRFASVVVVVVLAAVWIGTGYTVARPGDVVFVTRFGRVVDRVEGPDATWNLPYPFASFETVSTTAVDRVKIGPDDGTDPDPLTRNREAEDLTEELECVTSDEKLLIVTYAVHYRIRDAYRARYAMSDIPALVRACAASSLRRMAARRSMDEHLVERREPLESETRDYLAEQLDGVGAGVDVIAVALEYIHAPPQVHFAYRDVASALEDKLKDVKNGETYELVQMAEARGEAEQIEQEAVAARAKVLAGAAEVVASFEALAPLHARFGALLSRQLWLESAKRTYRDLRAVGRLASNVNITLIAGKSAGSGDAESAGNSAAKEDD